jgi:hypothetical protein
MIRISQSEDITRHVRVIEAQLQILSMLVYKSDNTGLIGWHCDLLFTIFSNNGFRNIRGTSLIADKNEAVHSELTLGRDRASCALSKEFVLVDSLACLIYIDALNSILAILIAIEDAAEASPIE